MLLKIDGHDAYCYTGGKPFDAALPTVVFIHGAQNDHSVWILQTRYFAHHGFSVLAVDLPGHGRSQGPALKSVEAMADWLLRVLDAAGVQTASLVGHSMGSLIALETQAKAPARVAKLALVGTAYPMKVSDTLLNAALNDEQERHRHGQHLVAFVDYAKAIVSRPRLLRDRRRATPDAAYLAPQRRKGILYRFLRLQRLRQRRSGSAKSHLPYPVPAGQARHDDPTQRPPRP